VALDEARRFTRILHFKRQFNGSAVQRYDLVSGALVQLDDPFSSAAGIQF
jgi:hypothetical protein